jgi:hypothetical protein
MRQDILQRPFKGHSAHAYLQIQAIGITEEAATTCRKATGA